ncbi:hypothetical protein [Methyloligella solikamskensis]|uniref:Uncharacterized protein n=1 Tax=Methyloligella solikamskensis TaxID=1177756 RepID=A0ABW3JCP2_9HYPH
MGKHLSPAPFRFFPTALRFLAALYEIGIDAAEGAIVGFIVFVFLVWTWPYPPPDWAVGTPQLAWGLGFAGAGAAIAGVRSWLGRKRRLARGDED